MLDDRLLGTTFVLPTSARHGEITLYGIHYHYRVNDDAVAGDLVVVNAVSPLFLGVVKPEHRLKY
ncbi:MULTISPECIES: hypothetical protein [Lacticaseibacillus]|uniref:Uncharacterized protein n=2 Tax=Lacticaseibacillus zeae TaxID=57037 RepID=A0A5R8LQB4_LACZE|nr:MULTISPECIES: hypothetical protein [Lacticaseibacillus]OFR98722.1 hypothetical protein HMPREF2861_05575 [Lactobacillus sp. HMSC068F07]KLI76178.1 hypothetical protein AAW28_03110 [Lacticaseibacillus casei]MDE3316904.1 hypothetical protein [Lacticaseibacillus zeae]TLF39373.1 hypothetical protein FEI15_07940 [Lacticaseibacillus zeae]WLV84536.1 hypothetical protein LACZS2_001010 [Lacticaseibacillus sp. NCIMB 15475]